MDYVFITGDVTSFQGTLQMSIKRARIADSQEYIPSDYLPVSEKNIDEMYAELMQYMRQVENPYLQKLIQMYFVDNPRLSRLLSSIPRQRRCITALWEVCWSIPWGGAALRFLCKAVPS